MIQIKHRRDGRVLYTAELERLWVELSGSEKSRHQIAVTMGKSYEALQAEHEALRSRIEELADRLIDRGRDREDQFGNYAGRYDEGFADALDGAERDLRSLLNPEGEGKCPTCEGRGKVFEDGPDFGLVNPLPCPDCAPEKEADRG